MKFARFVTLNERDLKLFAKQLRERPRFESLTLRTHLTDEEAARFALVRHRWNGVELRARLQRTTRRALAVHAIGYVGRINEDEMEAIDRNAYRGTQHIGKLGIEQNYEETLLARSASKRSKPMRTGARAVCWSVSHRSPADTCI